MRVSLADRLEVYDLFVRYADALDYRRWELLDDVFTEDVTSVWPTGGRFAGRKELVQHIQEHFAGIGPTHHLMGNCSVRAEGDRLVAVVRMRCYHTGAGERSDAFEESLGTFDGRARRTARGWRFEHFGEAIFVVLGSYDVFGLPGGLTTTSTTTDGSDSLDDPAAAGAPRAPADEPAAAARFAVTDTLDRYADAVDGRRWEILEEIFTDDVIWTWPDGRTTAGRAAVVDALRAALAHAGPSHTLFGSYRVEIDGDRARAKVHRRSYFSDATGGGRFMESLGDYRVEMVRRDAEWRIERFREGVFIRRGSADVFAAPDAA